MKFLVNKLRGANSISQDDLFKMENTIDFMVNSFDNFCSINISKNIAAQKYKELLSKAYETNINKIRRRLRQNDEYFEILFETGIGNDYYNLIWSVKKLKRIISSEKVKPVIMLTSPLENLVNINGITKDGLHRAKYNNKPIIIAQFPYLTQKYVIVDGNHRVMYKNIKGENHIDCYILDSDQHKNAFVNELFRYLFDLNAELSSNLHYKFYK